MYGIQINDCSYTERRKEENSSLYEVLSKDWFEVVKVDCNIASIPPFGIDILPSSESVQFDIKMTRTEPDDKVKLREVLRPLCLPLDQYLGSVVTTTRHNIQ